MAFAVMGFRDWKHATGKSGTLTYHNNCASHKPATVARSQYSLDVQRDTTVSEQTANKKLRCVVIESQTSGNFPEIFGACIEPWSCHRHGFDFS